MLVTKSKEIHEVVLEFPGLSAFTKYLKHTHMSLIKMILKRDGLYPLRTCITVKTR